MNNVISVAALRKELGPVLEQAHHNRPVMVSKRDREYASVVSHDAGRFENDLHQVAEEMGVEVDALRSLLRKTLAQPRDELSQLLGKLSES